MFNSNNKKKKSSMSSNNSGKNLPSVNMISEGTHVKGSLNTKSDIRIAGTLEGEAKAKGKVIISSTGKVEGDVEAVDADIAGTIEGEVRTTNKLILRQSAVINGDIHTKTMLVEEGAQINGSCHMNDGIKEKFDKNGTLEPKVEKEKQEQKVE